MKNKLTIKKKVEKILRESKESLDQVEIAERIHENPFIVSRILDKFQEKGLVVVEQ